ncbi:MAG: hypothetical protein OHK0012_10880 [Synechococcales cyanobacterium]
MAKRSAWVDSLTLGLSVVVGIGLATAPLETPWAALAQPTPSSQEEITPEQVSLFAKVVLTMEPLRQEAQQQANNAPDEAARDQIRRDFLRKATTIMNDNGLAIPTYNRIALRIRTPEGRSLKQQIEQEIINLQQTATPAP